MTRRVPWFRDVQDAADKLAPVTACLRRLSSAGMSKNGSTSYGTGTVQAFGDQAAKARNIINSSGCRIKSERVNAAQPGGLKNGVNWAPQGGSVDFEFEAV